MEYRVGICDEDYHYVVNLMEYVNSHKIGGMSLVAFSSLEAAEEYLGKSYLDGILIGRGIRAREEFADRHQGLTIIPMTEDSGAMVGQIYKYQSGLVIAQSILKQLNVSLAPEPMGGNAFCAVYSPLGRCGKTTLAKGLCVHHTNSLYVGMEEFGARDSLGEEILYHIIFENPQVHGLLDRIPANEYGVREVKGILSYMDIRQLTKENLQWLKEQLLVGGGYERVVFDIGGAVLADLNLLEVMDRIYVPVLEDEGLPKLQAFRELLRGREYGEIGRRLQYLNVPVCHYASELMREFIGKGEL